MLSKEEVAFKIKLMNNTPLVSVIIPTYNRAHLIKRSAITPPASKKPQSLIVTNLFRLHFTVTEIVLSSIILYIVKWSTKFGTIDWRSSNRAFSLNNTIRIWAERLQQLKNGEMTEEEYDQWRYSYPEGEIANRK